MWALSGTRAHVQALRGVKAPLEVEGRAAPGVPHERDSFLDAGPAVVAIGLEGLIVLQGAAAPDAHVEPPAADHVEHGHNTTHLRDRLLLAAVRLLAGWPKMPGERECYARFTKEWSN